MQGVKMKKFLVQIWAFNYHAKFEVLAEDNVSSVEQAVLDKLNKSLLDKVGQKDVKWESTGMFRDHPRRITYEEVINDARPIQYETVLGVRMATRAPEGREA